MMSQGIVHCQSTPEHLGTLYAPIKTELHEVEQILRRELCSDFPFVDRLAQHGFQLGGKRLRPALVLLSGLACGDLRPEHQVAAAVVELIHTATLIHDDVLDEADMRRHLETVNARWGNEASVLLGDYLFARAIRLATSLDDMFMCRVIADATRVMCEGELRQIGTRGQFELTEQEYLEIVAAKTADLCACCCRLGAYFSGADKPLQDVLARYGQQLGIAFQITDDVLDVRGDEQVVGKSLGTDLVKQKPTLPVIRLLNQVGSQDRAEVLRILCGENDHRPEAIVPYFRRCDGIPYSEQQAVLHVRRARAELDVLPPSPARENLKRLADFVVTRDQ